MVIRPIIQNKFRTKLDFQNTRLLSGFSQCCRFSGFCVNWANSRLLLCFSATIKSEWHSRGQRFDPAYLHHRGYIRTCSLSGMGSDIFFIWITSAHKKSCPCRCDRGSFRVNETFLAKHTRKCPPPYRKGPAYRHHNVVCRQDFR